MITSILWRVNKRKDKNQTNKTDNLPSLCSVITTAETGYPQRPEPEDGHERLRLDWIRWEHMQFRDFSLGPWWDVQLISQDLILKKKIESKKVLEKGSVPDMGPAQRVLPWVRQAQPG